MSEDPWEAAGAATRDVQQPDVGAALDDLDAASDLPLGEQADAFEAFHAALVHILDTEPAE